jgi:hypothetical protein
VHDLLRRLEAAGNQLEAITVRESVELPELAARLCLGGDGTASTAECLAPRGVPARPMSQGEITEKFRSISLPRRGTQSTAALEALVGSLGTSADLSGLEALLPFERAR